MLRYLLDAEVCNYIFTSLENNVFNEVIFNFINCSNFKNNLRYSLPANINYSIFYYLKIKDS